MIGQQPTNPPILSPSTLSILPHLSQSMHIAAQAPVWHGVWMVEDAVTGDEFPAWHGYGRRRMQPPGQAPAWCRAWIAKDVVWGVAAEAATASNKSSVGRGSEGRGCR
ncbi:Os02g0737500 [Oryza sativa Japonica Group]|uniref:Os02g0737500 protein n=2 Tax=Oryza sativa subsp. japonica TaxID=39947 RepID=A0A0P0VPD6_ORYSJ|nr:Os02g0737500 [Oryza sativa Japonica Group]